MKVRRSELKPDRAKCTRLVKLGVPIACQDAIISVGGLVLTAVVNMQGFAFMAGYNAASRLQGPIEVAGVSLASAMNSFAGQNIGAGRTDRIRQGLRQTVYISLVLAAIVSAVLVLFGRDLMLLFVQEEDAVLLEQVLTYSYRFLLFMAGGLPWLYLLFVHRSTLQGVGDTFVPMLSGIL